MIKLWKYIVITTIFIIIFIIIFTYLYYFFNLSNKFCPHPPPYIVFSRGTLDDSPHPPF